MNDNLNELFKDIRNECFQIIYDKNVDIDELSFKMGMSTSNLFDILNKKNEDFSLYLKLYELLLGW